jgi:hypothetical protein
LIAPVSWGQYENGRETKVVGYLGGLEMEEHQEDRSHQQEIQMQEVRSQADMVRTQLEVAKIQAETQAQANAGWQEVAKELMNRLHAYYEAKGKGERQYTSTLTIGILAFLVCIVGMSAWLTTSGSIGGESLVFFLGTLTGSVLMLVAERIRTPRQ